MPSGKRWRSCKGRGAHMSENHPQAPAELTDRQMVNTPIGPVCMSRAEYEMYRQELELRRAREQSKPEA